MGTRQKWSFQALHFTHSTRPDYQQLQRWMSVSSLYSRLCHLCLYRGPIKSQGLKMTMLLIATKSDYLGSWRCHLTVFCPSVFIDQSKHIHLQHSYFCSGLRKHKKQGKIWL